MQCADMNERRAKAGYDIADDAKIKAIQDEYANIQRTPQLIKANMESTLSKEQQPPAIFVMQNHSEEEKAVHKAKHELIIRQTELTEAMARKYAK